MSAQLIDGRKVASNIKENIKKEVSELKTKGVNPCLAVIFDDTDPTARKYVSLKEKACVEVGIDLRVHDIQGTTTQDDLVKSIERFNADPEVNGILLQFPLNKGLDEKDAIKRIVPEKDIDGCSSYSIGKLIHDEPSFIPCTPYGAIKMLEDYRINPAGKHTVVERNNSGKSLAFLLLKKNATVTICSSKNTKSERNMPECGYIMC